MSGIESAASAMVQHMQGMADAAQTGETRQANADGTDFGEALKHSIDRIDALKHQAEASGAAYESGEAGMSLDRVMVDMSRADIATNFGVQTRNSIVSAYKDIVNMQI